MSGAQGGLTATNLTYNGLSFADIKTLDFDQSPEYDESGVDVLRYKINIHVRSVLNTSLTPTGASPTGLITDSPALTIAAIRACLLVPRKQLVFSINGDVMIKQPISGPGVPGGVGELVGVADAKNGPLPQSLNITQITPTTFIIEYNITTWTHECCSKGGNKLSGVQIVSNRWQENVTIDENFFTTRTRTGVMFIRGDLAAISDDVVDSYRQDIVAVCPIPKGFRRVQSDYTLQKDGLAIHYTIKDVEQYAMPPAPGTKFEAEYRVVTHKSAIYDEEIDIKIWGPKPSFQNNSTKANLIAAAVAIAFQRMAIPQGNNGQLAFPKKVIKNGFILDRLHENYVQLKLQFQVSRSQGAYANLMAPTNAQKLDPPYVGASSPDPGAYGTAGLGLVSAILQDPCLFVTLGPNRGQVSGATSDQPQAATLTTVPVINNQTTLYKNQELSSGLYTDYVMDVVYEQDQKIIQLAVASSSIQTADFAYLANPVWKKRVKWTAEKLVTPPTCPTPESGDSNEILLESKIGTLNTEVEADGQTLCYRLGGEYIYGIVNPANVQLVAGNPPYLNQTVNQTVIPNKNFVAGLTSIPQQNAQVGSNTLNAIF